MKRIAIIGSRGRLGAALARELAASYQVIPLGREDVDLLAPVPAQLEGLRFEVMINCAAATNVDWCEQHPDQAERINGAAVRELAEDCGQRGARLIHVSTDYVFDGVTPGPLAEDALPNPINHYGRSKLLGERAVLETGPEHLVARVSWVFGPDRPSFIDQVLAQAQREPTVSAVADKWSAPTYTLDFVEWLRPRLIEGSAAGIFHLCNTGSCTWHELAEVALSAARQSGLPIRASRVEPLAMKDLKQFLAQRPVHTAMSPAKYERLTGIKPRPWQEAVSAYVNRHYRKA